jgi:predicted glutamate--cysteine ligase
LARDWIEQLYEEVLPTAKRHGFSCFLSPLKKILREGNEAQRWLKSVDRGLDPRQVIQGAIASMRDQEAELEDKICQPWVA